MLTENEKSGDVFIWKIENFSHCIQHTGEPLGSPIFTSRTLDKTKWRLCLYPRGMTDDNSTALELVRYLDDYGPDSIEVDCTLSFLDSKGCAIEERKINHRVFRLKDFWNCSDFLKPDLILGLFRNEYLANNVLSVQCHLWNKSGTTGKLYSQIGRSLIGLELRSFMFGIKEVDTLRKELRSTMKVEPVLEHIPPLTFSFFLDKFGGEYCIEIILEESRIMASLFCKLSIIGHKKNPIISSEYQHRFEYSSCKQYWRFPLCISKNKLLQNSHLYLVENTLLLRFDCTISAGVVSSEVENNSNDASDDIAKHSKVTMHDKLCMTESESPNSPVEVIDDLRPMFEEGILSDLKLCVGSKTFHVHKSILSARSSVFHSMFVEDKSDRVHVVDVDRDTMHRMLVYIYTGKIEKVDWEITCKLYGASCLYRLGALRCWCLLYLKSGMKVSNVCDLIELADTHNDDELKTVTKIFIIENDREVFKTYQWKEFETSHPLLSMQTKRYLYASKSS